MTEEPTIIRVASRKDSPYFLMARASAQDTSLSLAAVGLLTYLLSKPDNWQIRVTQLRREWKLGRDKMYALIKELRTLGYITGHSKQQVNGTWQWEPYYVHETPYTENQDTVTQQRPCADNTEIINSTECGENRKFAIVENASADEAYKSW